MEKKNLCRTVNCLQKRILFLTDCSVNSKCMLGQSKLKGIAVFKNTVQRKAHVSIENGMRGTMHT